MVDGNMLRSYSGTGYPTLIILLCYPSFSAEHGPSLGRRVSNPSRASQHLPQTTAIIDPSTVSTQLELLIVVRVAV